MPKDQIYTDTDTNAGGSSSEPAKAKFRYALAEPGSEMSKSRSKSKSKATTESTSTVSTPNQVEIIYNKFVSLGMPTDVISLTEFGRLYCPPHHSTSITIDSKSNSKSIKSTSKGKAKDTTTIQTTSTLTQALDFISTHLVGRQEVRKRRALISQCVQNTPSNHQQKLR